MAWHDRTWSLSAIKMLENCPLNFYLSYIEKYRYEDPSMETLARDLGTTIHYVLEMLYSGMTVPEALAAAEEEYFEVVGDANWHYILAMIPNVHKFNRLMHDKELVTPLDYIIPEQKLAIDRNYKPVDFGDPTAYFRGVIDFSWRTESGNSMVLDFKKGGNGFLTRYHKPQLLGYLILDYYGVGKYDEGESYIYYVEKGELSPGPKIQGENIETHTRPWLDDKINMAIAKPVDDKGFFHKRGSYCKYCDYQDKCKNGARHTSGDLIKYASASKEII